MNANVKSGAKTRHKILVRRLLDFDPRFIERLDPLVISAAGFDQEIQRLGESIQGLVGTINEAESAKSGKDLFKSTNKTTQALGKLSKPIKSYEDYKTLIDGLYFVFWEGPGAKLNGVEPASFKDINALRTAIQHDVDHGSTAKVTKKNKDLGKVFQQYAGVASPAVADPERFPVVQAKLLTRLEQDLLVMKASY